MPGSLVAQDVSHFHTVVSQIKSWDEAKAKKVEEEAKREEAKRQEPEPPVPASPTPSKETRAEAEKDSKWVS